LSERPIETRLSRIFRRRARSGGSPSRPSGSLGFRFAIFTPSVESLRSKPVRAYERLDSMRAIASATRLTRPESRMRLVAGARSRSGVELPLRDKHRPKAASYRGCEPPWRSAHRHPFRMLPAPRKTRAAPKGSPSVSTACENSPRIRRGVPRPCWSTARGF
jgi:hypothetical protein